jgi:hypothetical protein
VDTTQVAAAFAVIAAATVGIIEALKPLGLPPGAKPIASIGIGAALAVVYLVIPSADQAAFLVILAGATGTAGVAVATRVGGPPSPPAGG